MLRKEISDTLKLSVGTVFVFFIVVAYAFLLVRLVVDAEFPFSEFLPLMVFITMLGFSFYLGISLFAEEKNQRAFEYLLSLRFTRTRLLWNKLLPRFVALSAAAVLYHILSLFLRPFPVPGGWIVFLAVYMSLFLAAVSMSLVHRSHITTMVYALALFMITYAIFALFTMQFQELDLWGHAEVKFVAVCLFLVAATAFIGFCLHFRRMDLGNMTRLFLRSVGSAARYLGLPLLVLLIAWIVLNRFDARDPAPGWTMTPSGSPQADQDNGFWHLWTLSERPDLDVESDQQVILKYRRLLDPRFDLDRYVEHYEYWTNKATYRDYAKKRNTILKGHADLLSPWDIRPYRSTAITTAREAILRLRRESAVYLDRYDRMLGCDRFEDLTAPRFKSPLPNLLAWMHIAKLYNWLAILAAADGRWEEAEAKLLAHSECLRKAVTHSRLLLVHLVAKGILADTLNTLAVVMNLEGCPERFFRAILGRIPEANIAALGSETAFKADYLAFADYIEKRHFSLSDHWLGRLLGALFLQENRTKGYLHRPYADAIALEKIPPHRWKTNAADWGKRYGRSRQGLLWWIQNPVGKSVADTAAITNLRSVVHKSYNLIAIVDLLRISAEFRLRDDGTTPVETLLEDLTAYRRKDPYSGRSYGWNGERGVLYSHGPDLDDDRGLRSYLPDRDGDLILPVRLQRDPGRGGANPAPEE